MSELGLSTRLLRLLPGRSATGPLRGWTAGWPLTGSVLIAVALVAGLLGPLVAPYDPAYQQAGASLTGPGLHHLLGTDELGRDVLSRLLYGLRQDIVLIVLAVPLSTLTGVALGLFCSIHRWVDSVVQRDLDVVIAVPNLILGATLAAFIGAGERTVVIVIWLIGIPTVARLTRAAVISQRERDYVLGARAIGAGTFRVLVRHILPNAIDALVVNFVLACATAVFVEGALSLLGFGIQSPAPSLGSMIETGLPFIENQPAYVLAPVTTLTLLIIGLNLLADGLNRKLRA